MPDLSYLPQIALAGIAVGCIYGLIGIGFCVIYNASGIVNFAQGAFVMMGGMIAYSALKVLGLPLPVAAVVAIAAVAAVGVIIERVVVNVGDETEPGAVRVEAERALLDRPAIVAATAHEVDFLHKVLPNVCSVEVARGRIERKSEGVAEAEGEDLLA